MKMVFRADASLQIGTGHLMRCLTLAEGVRKKGAEVVFICRDLPGNLSDMIKEKGFALCRLSSPGEQKEELNWNRHAAWLGVDLRLDAKETLNCLVKIDNPVDWLIVDHYALDRQWEEFMRPKVEKIMVIDDLADRAHDCDVLLDQNLYFDKDTRYLSLLPENCRQLCGPQWALLRREFYDLREQGLERNGQVRRILVFMGGSDLGDVTSKVLHAIKEIQDLDFDIDVIMGGNSPNRNKVEAACRDMSRCKFHCQVSSLAEFMAKADLAIGGGGTATWERCSMKLPTLIISIAENQTPIAQALNDTGAAQYLGESAFVDEKMISRAAKEICSAPEALKAMGERAGQLVDARGTQRVVDELFRIQ